MKARPSQDHQILKRTVVFLSQRYGYFPIEHVQIFKNYARQKRPRLNQNVKPDPKEVGGFFTTMMY